ncbi:MAG: hypothetical protein ACKOZX_11520 [Gammaproteobacteria bacterium]
MNGEPTTSRAVRRPVGAARGPARGQPPPDPTPPSGWHPAPRALATALVAATLAGLLFLGTWLLLDRREVRMDDFGHATAGALGALSVEPLLKQDLLHLGVISNRLLELDEVVAVATYTADEQLLTLTGPLEAPIYSDTIEIDGVVVGHVRVALDPHAFASGLTDPAQRGLAFGLALASVVVASLAALFSIGLFQEWRAGRLVMPKLTLGRPRAGDEHTGVASGGAGVSNRGRDASSPSGFPDGETAHADTEPAPPPDVRHYLLGVNLHNQISLQGVEREFELSLCTELAEAVALDCQAQVVSLPGLGALIDFDDTDEPDRAFDVVAAALTLARLLRDEAPFGTYRLGLHVVWQAGDAPLPVLHPAVADVSLLSALARDHTLVMSARMAELIADADRLVARAITNPLLDELTTSSPGAMLVTELEPTRQLELLQRVERLKTQRDDSASESTF